MEHLSLAAELAVNSYPGRGIVIGRSDDGLRAVIAYFIMGRSANSRNRVFTEKDGGIITQAADPSKLEDPSLIIYAPVRVFGNRTIVTNGDQTDTIFEAYEKGRGFAKALRTRTFEPRKNKRYRRRFGKSGFEYEKRRRSRKGISRKEIDR